jgi:sulfate adenylyltransferase subunit 2
MLHIASGWDFGAMIAHRDRMAAEHKLDLIVHHNDEGAAQGINPFDTPTPLYTRLMLTEALKAALDKGGYDAAFGGGRRDEEKARAKERIFSFRNAEHVWDPKTQRPELWRLYNSRITRGESMRVFPLSNWTELDIWQYITLENIPIVPLYLAAKRPTVERNGMILMVDDDRLKLKPGEQIVERDIRFRTLGCYPLSGAVESSAATLPQVIQEMLLSTASERLGRAVDHDPTASMEKKKQEGYF